MYTIFISSFHANVSFDATMAAWILIKSVPSWKMPWRSQCLARKRFHIDCFDVKTNAAKTENSQSSSLRQILWHELRVMFFSLPWCAQQHLHLRCELRSIDCQHMPLLLWTASFAPAPEIRINHWIRVDNPTRRSNSYRFCTASPNVDFPWSEDN